MFSIFLLYVIGHCFADTSLQTDAMARGKSKHNPIDPNRVPKGQKPLKLWWHWLIHHSMIHGGIVIFITYFLTENINTSILFGWLEIISHGIIDYFKCENKYSPNEDQLLHLITKMFYTFYLLLL